MGPWARETCLRWRWKQFRFETVFTVPEIILWDGVKEGSDFASRTETINGSTSSRDRTHVAPVPNETPQIHEEKASGRNKLVFTNRTFRTLDPQSELVCWLGMLEALHEHEADVIGLHVYDCPLPTPEQPRPAVTFRRRSWDFQSSDTIRPHAVSNIFDIAILVHRLGMTWQDFRPQDGLLRAEGNGHLLTSTFSRSVGIILQYMRVGPSLHSNNYIHSTAADKMGFGILAGFPPLNIPEYTIGSTSEVLATADRLDPSGTLRRITVDIRHPYFCPTCLFGFSDIIPLASGMLRAKGSTIVRLRVPSEYVVGPTCHQEGFKVFHHRLQQHIASHPETASPMLRWVLSQYETLKITYPEWEDEALALSLINDRNLRFLDDVHTTWETATKYFTDLEAAQPPAPRLRYTALMAAHISQAVHYWKDATDRVKGENGKQPREHFGGKDWVAEGAHCYWDYLPKIAAGVRDRGCQVEDELVREAWCVMMLRAFCWWRTHYMVELGEEGGKVEMGVEVGRLPSRWWGSRLPVYVG
ncbi:hypothetical protein MMC18_005125 [Xylographa bjoerkii]|nr:hypothetical protein [Xylographa bjoerkii]